MLEASSPILTSAFPSQMRKLTKASALRKIKIAFASNEVCLWNFQNVLRKRSSRRSADTEAQWERADLTTFQAGQRFWRS